MNTQPRHSIVRKAKHAFDSLRPWIACFALVACIGSRADADWMVTQVAFGEADDDEAVVIQWTDSETDVSYVEVIYKDGTTMEFALINPDPVDGMTTPGDESSWGQLSKQKGGYGYLTPSWQNTPLGQFAGDKGPGHYYYPSDDGDEYGGQSPGSLPVDQSDELYDGGGVSRGGGFDFNGGSIASQLADALRGGKKGDDDNSDSGATARDGGFWGEDMPGPPELVNPATRSLK